MRKPRRRFAVLPAVLRNGNTMINRQYYFYFSFYFYPGR